MIPPPVSGDPRTRSDQDQWERAHQVWELVILCEAADLREDPDRRALFRILRVKRAERALILGQLPGVVRRGARVDLQPIEQGLREAGLPCVLRRTDPHGPPDRSG